MKGQDLGGKEAGAICSRIQGLEEFPSCSVLKNL